MEDFFVFSLFRGGNGFMENSSNPGASERTRRAGVLFSAHCPPG